TLRFNATKGSRSQGGPLARHLPPDNCHLPPDLAEVAAAWPAPPEPVRGGLLPAVRAAAPEEGGGRSPPAGGGPGAGRARPARGARRTAAASGSCPARSGGAGPRSTCAAGVRPGCSTPSTGPHPARPPRRDGEPVRPPPRPVTCSAGDLEQVPAVPVVGVPAE